MKFQQSPNVSKGRTIKPKGIILHHTAGSFKGSVSWCLQAKSKVSYHYIIDIDGEIIQLAKNNQRAWHAGRSSFKGFKNCNDFMIGIAVSGDTNKRLLTNLEVESVSKLCVKLMAKYNFGIDWVTTHLEVSLGRKNDIDIRANKLIKNRIAEILGANIDYIVKAGDTLFAIAQRFNTTHTEIMSLNKLTNSNIKVGQKLLIK